jgi:hypothetical protein
MLGKRRVGGRGWLDLPTDVLSERNLQFPRSEIQILELWSLQLMCHAFCGKRVQCCGERVQIVSLLKWMRLLCIGRRWRWVWLSCQCRRRLRLCSGETVVLTELGILESRFPRTRRDLLEREVVELFESELLEADHLVCRRNVGWRHRRRNRAPPNVEAGSAVDVYDVGIYSPRSWKVEQQDFRLAGRWWRRPVCVRDWQAAAFHAGVSLQASCNHSGRERNLMSASIATVTIENETIKSVPAR